MYIIGQIALELACTKKMKQLLDVQPLQVGGTLLILENPRL